MPSVLLHAAPLLDAAVSLLEANGLPASDLTSGHLQHFFYSGSAGKPECLVGIELHGTDALLRSLVVTADRRATGLGRALVVRAESHARAQGALVMYLLTTTAESFFARCGYAKLERAGAPAGIRDSHEFADICPASAIFMFKAL